MDVINFMRVCLGEGEALLTYRGAGTISVEVVIIPD